MGIMGVPVMPVSLTWVTGLFYRRSSLALVLITSVGHGMRFNFKYMSLFWPALNRYSFWTTSILFFLVCHFETGGSSRLLSCEGYNGVISTYTCIPSYTCLFLWAGNKSTRIHASHTHYLGIFFQPSLIFVLLCVILLTPNSPP
jgi:hypothetical protein